MANNEPTSIECQKVWSKCGLRIEWMTFKSTLGQTLDLLLSNLEDTPNLDLFTMNQYDALVKYKATFITVFTPVKLAMSSAGVSDPDMHRQADTILFEMGHLYQIQNDYLVCYGDPSITGAFGTDIQKGKCSWPAIVALEHATPFQKQIMQECYGYDDPDKVARVKQLYDDLALSTIYAKYEKERYNLIKIHIQQISCGLPQDSFLKFLSMLYRRNSWINMNL